MRRYILFVLIVLLSTVCVAQLSNATLTGIVIDQDEKPMEMVNVAIKNYPIGTTTNRKGEFLLRVPTGRSITIAFSMIGYEMEEREVKLSEEEDSYMKVQMRLKSTDIDEVLISGRTQSTGNVVSIDPKGANVIPGIGVGGIDNVLKTMPGVNSSNELSSQYSVRGGSFDENLVYVNDVEIYRPSLLRSGQQEGLSFVNSDMVSAIEFSAGGFDAKFGDKMSSVLNIRYKKPDDFSASASASLLGATAHVEGISKNEKLTYNVGLRYKSYRYLLNSLDEKGEYDPLFLDLQGYFTWKLGEGSELSLLSSTSANSYRFYPQTRSTQAGTFNSPYSLRIAFDGGEIDRYGTYTNALSYHLQPNRDLILKFIASAYVTNEEESYDILGYYWLNEIGTDQQSADYGDSVTNIGIGMYQEHGRNVFDARIFSISHKGSFQRNKHVLQWGVTAKRELVTDKMNEWIYQDSAGYSLPYSPDQINMKSFIKTNRSYSESRVDGYVQESFSLPISLGNLMFTGGARMHYWTFTQNLSVSPRISASLKESNRDVLYRLSAGWYHQPPFYRELKNLQGEVNPDIQTPRSFHVVGGLDFGFMAWNRPFRLSSEIYYKDLKNLVPYQVENVRIRYMSDLLSNGFTYGADLKINGEFVSGIQSWASISLLNSKEDIVGDDHGYIPRPSDQRFKFSFFFQDYLPGLPEYLVNLSGHYITGSPYGIPGSPRYMQTARMGAYKRFDIGITRTFVSKGENLTSWNFLNVFEDCSMSLEVFNMLDFKNVSSYFFVADYNNIYRAVPNYLTGRMFNLKLAVGF